MGKHNQILGHVQAEAGTIMLQLGIALVQLAKVALRLSPKCDNRMLLILWFGACVGGASQNGTINRSVTKFWLMPGQNQ